MECIFCKIAQEETPANIIYKDEHVVAFEDVNPQAPVHILVVPRKHISTSLDITDEDTLVMGYLFQVANTIAQQKGISDRGFRMVMNCNHEAGQTVFHVHLHVLGGRIMAWPPG